MKTIRTISKATLFLLVFLALMVLSPTFNSTSPATLESEFMINGGLSEYADANEPEQDTAIAAAKGDALQKTTPGQTTGPAKLALIIDDFGQSRAGVDEIMSINRPLTLAVMPFMEHTAEDAEKGFELGHEIILHMPMESKAGLGVLASWLGPRPILNSHSDSEVRQIYNDALDDIPHVSGANIHIGSLVSENEHIMTLIMEETAKRGLYFVDSKTASGSVCDIAAQKTGVAFGSRNFFLERTGEKSAEYAKSQLQKAARMAIETGSAIAIGHVGMEGGAVTAEAIMEMIPVLEAQGVELVTVSKLLQEQKEEVE